MNVERTIEFLLEHSARSEARFDRIDGSLERLAASQVKTETALRRAIRLAVKRDLVVRGQMQALRSQVQSLVDAQRRTEGKLDRLIETLRQGGNNGRWR